MNVLKDNKTNYYLDYKVAGYYASDIRNMTLTKFIEIGVKREMKVVYEVFIEDDNYDTPPTRIELIFSELTTLEEKILKENNLKYEYTDENKVKIRDENFIYCTVEIDNENKGIFLEKTKNYCNYIKGDYYFLEKSKNLVISKEGVKVELIFLKK